MEETEGNSGGAARSLLVLRAGGLLFAVYADEAEGLAENAEPFPLPHAPAAVLGVVSVRGRMYTLLDPRALLAAAPPDAPADMQAEVAQRGASDGPPRFAVALRGDEQLALAADEVEGPFELGDGADAPEPSSLQTAPLLATLRRGGEPLHLLDPSRLFDAAMHGTERRRQRT